MMRLALKAWGFRVTNIPTPQECSDSLAAPSALLSPDVFFLSPFRKEARMDYSSLSGVPRFLTRPKAFMVSVGKDPRWHLIHSGDAFSAWKAFHKKQSSAGMRRLRPCRGSEQLFHGWREGIQAPGPSPAGCRGGTAAARYLRLPLPLPAPGMRESAPGIWESCPRCW